MHFLTVSWHIILFHEIDKQQNPPTWRSLSYRKFSHLWQSKCGSRPAACGTRNTTTVRVRLLITNTIMTTTNTTTIVTLRQAACQERSGETLSMNWSWMRPPQPTQVLHQSPGIKDGNKDVDVDKLELIRPSVKIFHLIVDVILGQWNKQIIKLLTHYTDITLSGNLNKQLCWSRHVTGYHNNSSNAGPNKGRHLDCRLSVWRSVESNKSLRWCSARQTPI